MQEPTDLERIMLNAIKWRFQQPDIAPALTRADLRWLLSRIDKWTLSTSSDKVNRTES